MGKIQKTIYEGGFGELVVKKSRFLAALCPVRGEGEALAFIQERRKKYWDASHHCYAYLIGPNHEIQRCSDDGEPSQSAGRPMLEVLLGEEIHDACAVVTRYFGGTLLGTGGLARAYACAVKDGLKACKVVEKMPARIVRVTGDYQGAGRIQHLASGKAIVLDRQYTDQVAITFLVPEGQVGELEKDVAEATSAKAKVEVGEFLHYGMVDGRPCLFR